MVREGDTVVMAPGDYRDCAVWRTARIIISAMQPGTVRISGPICRDKGLFVIAAPDVTITGLGFSGAASSAGNGAGIRAEGGNLTITFSRFEDNENGILTDDDAAATLLIEDSVFIGNGALRAGQACAHGVYAGRLARLVIRRSRFAATQICHHVKSRAAQTMLIDNVIEDTDRGNSSYLVDVPNGGDLLLSGNILRKGPRSSNPATAIAIGMEGVSHPTMSLRIIGNRFDNLMGRPTIFVQNRSATAAELIGNRLRGPVVPLVGPGSVR